MLDSEEFVAPRLAHDLGFHCFQTDSQKKYLVRAKVTSSPATQTPLCGEGSGDFNQVFV